MSDDEDEVCRYGTPLDPINDDEVPSKKPITLADQIAVDSNGRRRFHGAFTGGFSAGYWNTVGSAEGWKPQEFRSSRTEKASLAVQKPNDFMDEEDVSEFGIAPQRIQTTEDFTPTESERGGKTRGKRKILPPSEGPIPGIPVLQLVLESSHDKVAVRLLKRMLAKERPNAGVTKPRKERKKKSPVLRSENEPDETEAGGEEIGDRRLYMCDMGPIQKRPVSDSDTSDSDEDDEGDDLKFQPDEFDAFEMGFKIDRFGLDYTGLDRNALLGGSGFQQKHVNLFSSFEMVDKNNKKVSIRGQAFGVGAFEDDDDDIYAKDDMSSYDFRLEDKRETAAGSSKAIEGAKAYIAGFKEITTSLPRKKVFYVDPPRNFEPRNWLKRRSRFGPALEQTQVEEKQIVGRHDLTPSQRGAILNEKTVEQKTKSDDVETLLQAAGLKSMSFVSTSTLTEKEEVPHRSISPSLIENVDNAVAKLDEAMKGAGIDKEFQVPETCPLISDRFVSEGTKSSPNKPEPPLPSVAVEKKEIKINRTKTVWIPTQLLCYKMNIETTSGTMPDHKPNTFSLFSCLASGNEKKKNSLEFTNTGTFLLDNDNEKAKSTQMERNQTLKQQQQSRLPVDEKMSSPVISMPSASALQLSSSPSTSFEHTTNKDKNLLKPIARKDAPATELEQKILDAQDKHPSQKMDIFKAIFEDSDDDDEDTEINTVTFAISGSKKPSDTSEQQNTGQRMNSSSFLDLPKTAEEMNILRNLSPPRGIFASLAAKSKPAVDQTKNISENNGIAEKMTENSLPADCYGPSLPPTLQKGKLNTPAAAISIDTRARGEKANTMKVITEREDGNQYKIYVEEKWIEKGGHSSSSSNKKEKKAKKEKKHKKEKKNKKEKHKSGRHRSRSRSRKRSRSRDRKSRK